tara:strand:- start:2533 stop:3525 length:993 start_codon:yes stop_codon:yes gene_type:complete
MWQRVIYFIIFFSGLSAQSFFYNYIDPCEQTRVKSTYSINQDEEGFLVTYYNRSRFFTLDEVLAGELEIWAENVYTDFEDLFPCAVRVAEEVLSSTIAQAAAAQFSKTDDISVEPQQVNYAIQSVTKDTIGGDWVTSFNSVYTATSFDGKSTHDAYFNFTDDFKKASLTYGRGFKYTAKKQNQIFSTSLVSYQTFQGWDWLGSVSYSKSLIKPTAEAFVLTGSFGSVTNNTFGNVNIVYGMRAPLNIGFFHMTLSNYVAYTLMRYYRIDNQDGQYLYLRSPLIFFPTIAFDWKLGQAFSFNIGFSMGYNTVINDYGERNKTYSILFGTYF